MSKRSKSQLNRRRQFLKPKRGFLQTSLLALGVAGFVVIAATVYLLRAESATPGGAPSPPAQVLSAGDVVRLPVSLFADGRARFYRYTTSIGRDIRFFVVRSSDGVVRAAFDACDVCYRERKGYYQDGDDMVCENCGQRFRCNPSPLRRTVDGDQIVLSPADLDIGSAYF
jgi:uncharacterized membrane protein